MQFSWFTFIAQIINFLILVALLRHFLYGRIMSAMDRREEKIRSSLEQADASKKEAQAELEEYRTKNKELDETREQLILEARAEVERKRREFMEEARSEVAQLSAAWKEALAKEKGAFLETLRRRTAAQVYAVARKALSDLADADLEAHIVRGFMEQIGTLDEGTRNELAESLGEADHECILYSSFEIPEAGQQELSRAIRETLGEDVKTKFQISQELICGIEIKTRSRKIAWSIGDYLETQEESLFANLEREHPQKQEEKS